MSVKNSAGVLKQLRGLMKTASCLSEPLHAYIIPSGDAHMVNKLNHLYLLNLLVIFCILS